MGRAIKEHDADSITDDLLHAIDGTALEGTHELNPMYCLKVLALFRFMNPTKEIRISGGREVNLRSLQPLGLFAANSMFSGDYLTTEGQARDSDFQMLKDLGCEINDDHSEIPVYKEKKFIYNCFNLPFNGGLKQFLIDRYNVKMMNKLLVSLKMDLISLEVSRSEERRVGKEWRLRWAMSGRTKRV